jgi:GTP pyrophosphokinase
MPDETGQKLYDALREKLLRQRHPDGAALYAPEDMESIDAAYRVAAQAHDGCRESGEPYISHPIAVSGILADIRMDTVGLVAALLHDVVEDTRVTNKDIQRQFGKDVAEIVEGLTKIQKLNFDTEEDAQAENVRKMLLAMYQDIRVIVIKLADRLHNMRTLQYKKDPQKRRDIAKETYNIFAKIADRLGMRFIKEELEDLSLRYLDGYAYNEIEQTLALDGEQRERQLAQIRLRVQTFLQETLHTPLLLSAEEVGKKEGFFLQGRVKSIAGIFHKMYEQHKTFHEINDVYAVRVILRTVQDCYVVMGLIQQVFKPVAGRTKDYIATQKANGYQSIHLTLLCENGTRFELQIRTWEMHLNAEYGVAAHWMYKLGLKEEHTAWVKQITEIPEDSGNTLEILESIKRDISPDETIYVMTPKLTVLNLPAGSTVIDFAYAVHTDVGHTMSSAEVDDRIVPFTYALHSGEVCKINRASTPQCRREWMHIARTTRARNKISSWFRKEKKEENITEGRIIVQRELRHSMIRLDSETVESIILDIISRKSFHDAEDFYAAIGYGGVNFNNYIPRFREEHLKRQKQLAAAAPLPTPETHRRKETADESGVIVDGLSGMKVTLSPCCAPMPGDPIIGHTTRFDGVKIHASDCVNVPQDVLASGDGRWLPVHWGAETDKTYAANLVVQCHDGIGRANEIFSVISGTNINILSNRFDVPGAGDLFTMYTTVQVADRTELARLIRRLQVIPSVENVYRKGRR